MPQHSHNSPSRHQQDIRRMRDTDFLGLKSKESANGPHRSIERSVSGGNTLDDNVKRSATEEQVDGTIKTTRTL